MSMAAVITAATDMDEQLRRLPFWASLTADEQELLRQSAFIRRYEKGAYVHSSGQECLGLLLVLSGELRSYLLSDEGREVTLFRLYPGELCVLSASCVISQISFDTQLSARQSSELLIIPAGTVAVLKEKNLSMRCFLYEQATQRFSDVMWAMQQILFKRLDRGMKVILDGVFNHCGSFNKWMDRERIYEGEEDYEPGAYVSADSPYRSYFRFFKEGPENWPYNGNYDGWWGHDTLPKLNYEDSVKLENYILYIGRKWVSPPYNVDGWRLDVAADLGRSNEYNHEFWQKFRRAVKDANPNALILAEHYGDPSDWLKGDEWDTVMNYDAFMEPVTWFLTGMEKHSDEAREELLGNIDNFIGSMAHHMSNMLTPSLQVAMNELSNHDHSRFLTRTNHMVGRVEHLGPEAANEYVNKAVMREAVVMQMTWVGAPTVYYGDEAGVCGFTDPDNRRTYPWGHEDQELIAFHKEAIRIHKEHPALKTGSLKILGGEENILSYARFKGHDRIIVVINNRSERAEVKVPVWEAEIPIKCRMKRLLYSYKEGYTTEYEEYLVEDGEVVANMGPHSALVLGMRNEEDHDWLYIL